MSFNSEDPSLFNRWGTKSPAIPNDLFTFENTNYSFEDPFKLGVSIGVKFKNKNELILGAHYDGVSSKSKIMFWSYQSIVNNYTTGIIIDGSTGYQSRFFLAYKYYVKNKDGKTSLALLPSIGIVRRTGGRIIENVGTFGYSGVLTKDGLVFESTSSSYTNGIDKAFVLGFGISSDFYIKSKYFCSLSLQYSHTKKSLYFEETRMNIINKSTNQSDLYVFKVMNRASGLYLTLSRKIRIYPKNKTKIKSS